MMRASLGVPPRARGLFLTFPLPRPTSWLSLHTSTVLYQEGDSNGISNSNNDAPKDPAAAVDTPTETPATEESVPSTPADAATSTYTTPELTADAAAHRQGLTDPDRPHWQNPLHHGNPDNGKIFPEDFDTPEAFHAATVPLPPLEYADGTLATPEYLRAMADEIVHLNMLEMNELVNKIADHYGFDDTMLSPDDGADDGDGALDGLGGAAAAPVEEKKVFDLKLVSYDDKAKIKVIKEVRSLAGLGLKEAKEMVEGAPKVILKDIKKELAEECKAKLEEIGAVMEIV
jgi:large subunit ribosomal protein L7/L12